MHQITRRALLGAAPLLAMPLPALASATPAVPPAVLARALAAHERYRDRLDGRGRIVIADFARPSRAPRFHLVQADGRHVASLLVAHGKGSDPAHTGFLQRFSAEHGSEATSAGAYASAEEYHGKHGASMRLDGLEPSNATARDRAIVLHGAWYVSDVMVAGTGKIGRSQGCFAVAPRDLRSVMDWLGQGGLIWAERA